MSAPQRRVRRNTKSLDAIKAAAIILSLLLGCILILWLVTPFLRPKEPQPDLTPQPGKSMWDVPAPVR